MIAAVATAAEPPDARHLERRARLGLENGRALLLEGRAEAAERVLRRALAESPNHYPLERALAHVLDTLGRSEDAQQARQRANRLHPRPTPPPNIPLVPSAEDVLVVFVRGVPKSDDLPGTWPDEELLNQIRDRLAVRLPGSRSMRADPDSVASARRLLQEHPGTRVISLRVDRSYCGFSIKDGQLAAATLRAVLSIDGSTPLLVPAQAVIADPLPRTHCEKAALERSLELAIAPLASAAKPAEPTPPTSAVIRALFPDLDRRITAWLRKGRTRLAAGSLVEAQRAFVAARKIDPLDPIARDHEADVLASLALAEQLAPDPDAPGATRLDPRLSFSQRAAAETALSHAEQRRDELLATLAVLDEDILRPSEDSLANLRQVEIHSPESFGPVIARERAGGAIDARVAYAPSGDVIARYYFPAAAAAPVLREDDTNGDGAADRWIAYAGIARKEIFEDRLGRGRPDLHLVFSDNGTVLQRVEVDRHGDSRPERILRYLDGVLEDEASDTDGDGELDQFDQFDGSGSVAVREQDLDGNGSIDVRSEFTNGKLVRRTLEDPIHAPES